jgi:transcriptional regulator with XRE-family HTH domain
MNNLNKSIGSRIRELRKKNDISMEKMAERLKISYSTYQRIETGETNSWATHLEEIASVFDVEMEEIVLDKEKITQHNTDQKGGVAISQNLGTINTLSEKVIELYESKLQDKDIIIEQLKQEMEKLKAK